MRALVTGAAGFIGSNLVDRLLAENYQVVGVDNLSSGRTANLDLAYTWNATGARRFTFISLDVQAPELTDVVEGCNPDVVFHLAAQPDPLASMRDPQFDARNNVVGTINLCEATRRAGIRRVVYAGAGEAAWCGGPGSICDLSTVAKLTPHNAAKAAGDLYLRAYASAYALDPVTLMLGTVYGPRQSTLGGAGLITGLCGGDLSGAGIEDHENAFESWDFVYIDDVVDAFVRAAELPADHAGSYPVTSGRRTSFAELLGLVAEGLQRVGAAGSGDDRSTRPSDLPLGEHEFVWCPKVDLQTGLLHTMCWLGAASDIPVRESA